MIHVWVVVRGAWPRYPQRKGHGFPTRAWVPYEGMGSLRSAWVEARVHGGRQAGMGGHGVPLAETRSACDTWCCRSTWVLANGQHNRNRGPMREPAGEQRGSRSLGYRFWVCLRNDLWGSGLFGHNFSRCHECPSCQQCGYLSLTPPPFSPPNFFPPSTPRGAESSHLHTQ